MHGVPTRPQRFDDTCCDVGELPGLRVVDDENVLQETRVNGWKNDDFSKVR